MSFSYRIKVVFVIFLYALFLVIVEKHVGNKLKKKSNDKAVFVRDIFVPGYQITNQRLCPYQGINLSLFIFIPSDPAQVEYRNSIRMTWGFTNEKSDYKIAFVIGDMQNITLKKSVLNENAINEDIILVNVEDVDIYISLRVLSILDWICTYCPLVDKIMKVDEKTFINVPLLLQFIKNPSVKTAKRKMWGSFVYNDDDTPGSMKYLNSLRSIYSQVNYSRIYLSGWSYLLTSDCVPLLYEAAIDEPFIAPEDIFFTGIVASQLGLVKGTLIIKVVDRAGLNYCVIQKTIAILGLFPEDHISLWAIIHENVDPKTECSSQRSVRNNRGNHYYYYSDGNDELIIPNVSND